MCGIVGFIGKKKSATAAVIDGLEALEYRGYDSAGIAFASGEQIEITKTVGGVQNLRDQVIAAHKSTTAIGHTRWATHGAPSTQNAHPHYNTDKTIAVVHNGIIENYQEIRTHLKDHGYTFISETDSEVLPHLIDYYFAESKDLQKAIEQSLSQVRGAYGIAILSSHEPDNLYAARLSSPLVAGITKDAALLASDANALLSHTKDVVYLNDYELIKLQADGSYHIIDYKHARPVKRAIETLDYDASAADKAGYPHFMLKEMHEAPTTIRAAIGGRIKLDSNSVKLGGLETVKDQLRHIDRIVIVACGTSYYAGMVGEYLIEELAGIPVEVQLASEFKYRHEPFSRSTALIAISQSGETADTIAALQKVENYGVLRLGIVNAVGSTIARMTDAGVYCHAGPEQAVASTKAFIAQVTVLTLLALHLSQGRSPLYKPVLTELTKLPLKVETVLSNTKTIEILARKYKASTDMLYIGRGYSYPCALEGALKLKELSYIHAEGYAAGEMKHGPLAMIDPDFPTFAIATQNSLYEKTISNIEEIKARKGPLIALATDGDTKISKLTKDVLYIPKTLEQTEPILIALVEQLFSYYVAVARGQNVDRPRNLAKSVTVE